MTAATLTALLGMAGMLALLTATPTAWRATREVAACTTAAYLTARLVDADGRRDLLLVVDAAGAAWLAAHRWTSHRRHSAPSTTGP